ncbi:MAG: antibiotic biosynthesis monooxygenase [Acidimicrobiia bacterium]
MILEVAVLDVIPNLTQEFEAAFAEAKRVISASPGFQGLELQRCVERPSRYVLLVRWESLEDHTVGFRGSAEYSEWSRLLHRFYDPFPTVEHYESVVKLAEES